MVSLKSFKLINEGEVDEKPPRGNQNIQDNILIKQQQQQLQQHRQQTIFQQQYTQVGSQLNEPTVGGNDDLNIVRDLTTIGSLSFKETNNNLNLNNDYNDNPTVAAKEDYKYNKMAATSGPEFKENDDTKQSAHESSYIMSNSKELMDSRNGVVSVVLSSNNDKTYNNASSQHQDGHETAASVSPAHSSSSISIVVVTHDANASNIGSPSRVESSSSVDDDYTHDQSSVNHSLEEASLSVRDVPLRQIQIDGNQLQQQDHFIEDEEQKLAKANQIYAENLLVYSTKNLKGQPGASPDMNESRLSVTTESEHFEIVWSNLTYKIQPKWYKKFNYLDRFLSQFMSSQTVDNHSSATSTASSSAGMNDNQHQMHSTTDHCADVHPNPQANMPTKSSLDPIEIFSNLNGTIKSGQMTAVLGPSGAGKTTLLNCLTGKLRNGVSGHINLKGANGKHLKMCTIPQKDHLLELLTVEENLWFASKIKNPEYGFDHVKNIERVIDLLGLKRCRKAKIGKISGGQHKRVSIAQELLSNPDILVLDEPTSGLDSLTCFKTISMLRDLVELSANNDFMKPMAIIVTIHQPQPKVFNLFHHVYILANGGRVIYEGAPEQSLSTITSVTGLQPYESTGTMTSGAVDPASFLIEIASEEYGVDVINTLNDYQRSVFHETNDARNLNRQNRKNKRSGHFNIHEVGLQRARDNHGFTPDFESSSSGMKQPTSVFIMPTKDSNNPNERCKDEISNNGQLNSRKSSRTKKRKKSAHSLEGGVSSSSSSGHINSNSNDNNNNNTSQHANPDHQDPNLYMSEQLLYTRVPNHKGRFWSHTATLTHRTLLTIRRDPLLMTSRVLFHLMIPILMGHVYGKATGAANACPHYEPEIDITQIPSLVEGKRIEYMLEELHMSIENVSMFFIIMYAFAAAVLALNALSFPLNMQVLLKETRNGWYSMSSYVLAKTLADLPLELTMPCLTMLLVYPLTGQPSSYLQWRMLTICLIMTLCSLIAQTQALILGALVMNSVQTAVFVSQASQLPWVILAGFTIRIKRLSEPLKLISLTSFYRLGCEAITLTRYGFGICPCNPQEITGEPVKLVGIPDQLRTVAQYWLDSMEASKSNDTSVEDADDTGSSLITTTTPMSSTVQSGPKTDIFQHIANQLSYANSYGVNITSCDDVAPDRIRAINLGDNWLVARIWHLFIMLIIMKILLYYAVRFSIGIRL